jgi:hypothetical protein
MIPLILIWFGIGMWSKVFIVFISAFFPVLVNTVGGMRAIDRDLCAPRAFCASDWQIFKTVAIPVGALHPHWHPAGVALGLIGGGGRQMSGGSGGGRFHGGALRRSAWTFATEHAVCRASSSLPPPASF